MPASYAHYRFGKLLLPRLPADIRQTVQRFRRMYDVGLQGPDFFFYYNIFLKTPTGELGSSFHRQPGREFFREACKAGTSDAAKAYLYGLLGHYCLDSICHPFVNRLVTIGEARHVPLESEFERFLLALDKVPSPATFDRSKNLRLTRGECMTVAGFYPGTTGGKVYRSLSSMACLIRLLAKPGCQRRIPQIKKILPGVCDHMIPAEENPDLTPYIGELHDLYQLALEQYPGMLSQLTGHLQTGEPFGDAFAPDFG